jgi:hypothetical protein
MVLRRRVAAGAAFAFLAIALAPVARAQGGACAAWQIEYALAGNLRLEDTPFGQGDGLYAVGPGSAVIRFEDRDGQPGGAATLRSYELHEHFTVTSKALVWTTTVVTDATTRAGPEQGGVIASGALRRTTLEWSTPLVGYRTDGTLTCEGQLCGKFGAPPPGRSELHIGPGQVPFGSFEFSRDAQTFTMASTLVSKTDAPRQTTHLALSGRETSRQCIAVR